MKALLASLFAALFALAALTAYAATPLSDSGMSAQPQSAPPADDDDKDKDKDKDGGKKPE